jgi:hypothetical protein
MLTFRCCLRFSDGEKVVGQLTADSLLEDAAISYEGPIQRLPVVPPIANAVELKAYFKSFARELQARYSEKLEQEPVGLADETTAAADSCTKYPP